MAQYSTNLQDIRANLHNQGICDVIYSSTSLIRPKCKKPALGPDKGFGRIWETHLFNTYAAAYPDGVVLQYWCASYLEWGKFDAECMLIMLGYTYVIHVSLCRNSEYKV